VLDALAWTCAVLALVALAAFAVSRLLDFGVPVALTVDGQTEHARSARSSVGELLADVGLVLRPEDRLTPSLDTPLSAGMTVIVGRARPGLVQADGKLRAVHSQARTVGELVADAGLMLGGHDEIWLDGRLAAADEPLPPVVRKSDGRRFDRGRSWMGSEPDPVRVSIRRAVSFTVDDGSVPYTLFTTAETIGEALQAADLTLYLGDRVQPELGSRVSAGLRVHIERSTPVIVTADGRTTHTRTRGKTVGSALIDLGLLVGGSDRVTPALHEEVANDQPIRVVRVSQVTLVESEPIPYESISVPDDNLELDTQRLAQAGQNGEFRRRWYVVREDGEEVSRQLTDAWIAAEPVTRMVAYGRQIVLRTLDTPDGPITYWRKVRMYGTSYSPARSGTPVNAAWYGRTRIGLQLHQGIVAVDPNLIPLRSYVYVPGYGKAIAGDTGGGVRGKMIDMGYGDADYVSWHWWTDVYLLDPPPSRAKIVWVLPNYPPASFPRRR
jgi:resuscitation-promoting factor RpfB